MMTEQKGQRYQGVKTVEASESENTTSGFNCCYYCKNEKLSDANFRETAGTQRAFSDKITSSIDGSTDEPFFQCNVQVVENTFIDDFK